MGHPEHHADFEQVLSDFDFSDPIFISPEQVGRRIPAARQEHALWATRRVAVMDLLEEAARERAGHYPEPRSVDGFPTEAEEAHHYRLALQGQLDAWTHEDATLPELVGRLELVKQALDAKISSLETEKTLD